MFQSSNIKRENRIRFIGLVMMLIASLCLSVSVFAKEGTTTLTAGIDDGIRSVTVQASEGGSITPSAFEGKDGDRITFTLKPDKGFHAAQIMLNGKDITDEVTGDVFIVELQGNDITVSVRFAPDEHVHQWESEFTVDKEPTYTEEGSKSIHCALCDARKDITPIPKLVNPTEPTDEDVPADDKKEAGKENGTDTGDGTLVIPLILLAASSIALIPVFTAAKRHR